MTPERKTENHNPLKKKPSNSLRQRLDDVERRAASQTL